MGDIVITPASNDVNSTAGTLVIRTSDAQAMSLRTNDVSRINITSAGNVGIGTTSPSSLLDVSGIVRFDSLGAAETRSVVSSAGQRIFMPSGGVKFLGNSSTGAIRIKGPINGNTDSMHTIKGTVFEYATAKTFEFVVSFYYYSNQVLQPTAQIIGGPSGGVNRNFTVRVGRDSNSALLIYIGELADTWNYGYVYITEVFFGWTMNQATINAYQTGWSISTEASTFENVMATIADTQITNWSRNGSSTYYNLGNVGIGITNPSSKLYISGGTIPLNNRAVFINADVTTNTSVYTHTLNLIDTTNDSNATSFALGTYSHAVLRNRAEVAGGAGGILDIYTRVISGDPTVKMSVTSDGKVGIGTTAPTGGLHINNTPGAFSEALRLQRNGGVFYSVGLDTNFLNIAYNGNVNANNVLVLTNGGYLGVGNLQNALFNLDVASTQGKGIQLRFDNTTGYRAQIIPYWNSNTDTRIDFAINRIANTAADVIMSVGYNSNVGIGTTVPTGLLNAVRNTNVSQPIASFREVYGSPGATNVTFIERGNNLSATNQVSSNAGLRIRDHTSNYSLSVEDHLGNVNFAISGAKVMVGSRGTSSLLNVGGAGSTTAASGITFGDDAQANLYRAAEDTIKTDGSLNVAGLIYNGNSAYYSSVSKSTTANWGQYSIILGNSSYSSQIVQVSVNGGNLVWAGTFLASCHLSYRPNELWTNVKLLEYSTYNCSVDDVTLLVMSNSSTSQYGTPSLVLKTNGSVNGGYGTGYANTIVVTVNGPSPNDFVLSSSSWAQPYTYQIATSANTKQIYVNESGNIGIGTTSTTNQANYKFLQVNGTNSAVIETMVGGTRIGGFDSTSSALYVGTIGNFPVIFRTQVDEKMRIAANGNVGISSTIPGAKLDVGGTLRTSGNILSHKTASYTTSYPGINSFGADATDANITYYDTGKNVLNQNFRGVVWTGKHYIFTDYFNNRAYFYDNNFVQITNAYGFYFVTLPLPSGSYVTPHGATWDGRYLWMVVYTGSNTKIIGYDLDTTTQTATIIAESAALPYGATYDVEYADGHLYTIVSGTLYIYKWNGSTIDLIASYAGSAGSITAQAITYDGSYLWATQNGAAIYKIGLDGTPIATISSGFPPDTCGWAWNGSNIVSFDYSARDIYIINTTRLRIDTQNLALMGGKVGIGITNPGDRVQANLAAGESILANIVSNAISASNKIGFKLSELGTAAAEFSLVRDGTTYQAKLQTLNNQPLSFGTNTTTRMVIGTSGNVGIGSTTPTALLNVRASIPTSIGSTPAGTNVLIDSNTSNYITFRNTADNGTYAGLIFLDNNIGGYITFGNAGAAAGSDSMIYGAYQDHIFQNGYINETLYNRPETLRIKANGRVGIGTNTPTTLLSVGGPGSTTAASGITLGGDSVANLYRAAASIIKTDSTLQVGGNFDGFGSVQAIGSILHRSTIRVLNKAATDWVTWFTRDTSESETIGRLDSIRSINGSVAGNLGIGTTLPSGKLHVVSSVSNDTVLRADGTNGTLFSVVDDLSDSLMSVNNSAGLPVLEVFADDRIIMGQYGSGDLVVRNNKVGIGTTNPINKLSVIGGASIGSSAYNIATPTNGLLVEGNVGIGTTSVGHPLEVYGTSMDPSLTPSAASIVSVNSLGVELAIGRMVTSPFSIWLQGKHATVGGNLTYPITLNPLGGNVGIGMTNPSQKLDVNGNTRAERYLGINSLVLNTYATVNPASNVFLYSQGNDRDSWLYLDSADTASNWGIYHRQIDSTVSNLPGNSIGFIGGGASTLQSYISLANGSAYFASNVGIGIASPSSLLHVYNSDSRYLTFSSAGLALQRNVISTNAVSPQLTIINTQGSDAGLNRGVGIQLDLGYGGSATVVGTAARGARVAALNETNYDATAANQNAYLAFYTATAGALTEKLRISSAGNVGIGTTDSLSLLAVGAAGSTSAANGITFGGDAQANIYRNAEDSLATDGNFNAAGNVGIGIANPTNKLHVIVTTPTGSRIQLGSTSTNGLMNAGLVNDFLILTAPFNAVPASTSNNNAKWGIKMNGGSTDAPNVLEKSACIYAVSEEDSVGGAGYNRKVGLALHTSPFDLPNVERVRINNLGNVGIGSTNPGTKLDVVGNINIDGSSFHRVANDSVITAPSDHGLVAYYGFDEGSALLISDKTGRNNTFAAGSLTFTTTAIRGTALDGFGSDSNYVVIPDSADFDFGTGDFAVSLWCRPNSSFTNSLNTLMEIGLYTAGMLIRPQNNTLEIYIQSSLITSPAITWTANTWYHIVVTRINSVLNVYSNGTRISSVANTSNIQVASAGYIGRSAHSNGQFFYGIIDEVKIYKGKGLDYGEVRGQYLSRGNSVLVAPIFSTTNGNVGIGASTPAYKLDVRGQTFIYNGASNALLIQTTVADGNTRDGIYLYENDGAASGRQAISWYNGNQNYYKARLWTEVGSSYAATTFGIDVADDSRVVATRFAIRNGNVGINTAAPVGKFDVYDDTNAGHISFVRNLNTGSSAYTAMVFRRNGGNNGLVMFTNSSNRATDGGAGNSTIRTDNGKLLLGAGATTYHALETDGNVGIGLTNPVAARLHIKGNATDPVLRVEDALLLGAAGGTAGKTFVGWLPIMTGALSPADKVFIPLYK